MRKWAVVLLLAVSSWPAMAAKSVNVGQLDQLLDTLRGKSDGKVAGELSDLQLTERASPARLAHSEKDFSGTRTQEALTKLVDLAAFLGPPADDVVPIPGPDNDTQERMLSMAVEYVKSTITGLPNFLATRVSIHFEDSPSMQTGWPGIPMMAGRGAGAMRSIGPSMSGTEYRSLHSTGNSSTPVAYRDGREVQATDPEPGKTPSAPSSGLTTMGEFGPILSVVIGDALRSEVTWQRWEKGTGEPVAVFRYAVPEEQSNYMVGLPTGNKIEQIYPAYNGEIAIDPATGAILRISVVSVLPPPHLPMQTAILVEYAPVAIGEQSYICPVHGVAFSKSQVVHAYMMQVGSAVDVQTQLNDVAFTQYHLFRSKSRIVTGDSGTGDAPVDAAPPAPQDSTSTAPASQKP